MHAVCAWNVLDRCDGHVESGVHELQCWDVLVEQQSGQRVCLPELWQRQLLGERGCVVVDDMHAVQRWPELDSCWG